MGKLSDISEVNIPEMKLRKLRVKILSISVHVSAVTRVGFEVTGKRDRELTVL